MKYSIMGISQYMGYIFACDPSGWIKKAIIMVKEKTTLRRSIKILLKRVGEKFTFKEKFSEESILGKPKKKVVPIIVFIVKNKKDILTGINIPGIPPINGKNIDRRER
jgi:hypothetical protein